MKLAVVQIIMNTTEQSRFDKLYHRHLRALKLRGMSDKTIEAYARAVRRVSQFYDCDTQCKWLCRLLHNSPK